MTTVTTIRDYPNKITIKRIGHNVFEVNAEYDNKMQNFTEIISGFNIGGIKYTDILRLIDDYSKEKRLNMTNNEGGIE